MTGDIFLSIQNIVNELKVVCCFTFIATLSMATLSHRKPTSSGESHDSCDVMMVIKETHCRLFCIMSYFVTTVKYITLIYVYYFFLGCVLKLVQASGSSEITDDNAELQNLCQNLERVFQQGLLRNTSLGFAKVSESWYWLEQLASQHSG
jgi:hypothetical protein